MTTPAPIDRAERGRAIDRLRAAGCVFAEEETDLLACAAADAGELAVLVERRASGVPVEQVVGHTDFCGVRITLRRGVFVPRPRTAALVRRAIAVTASGATVVDLCCGSGALAAAVAARVPGIALHAADVDPAAVACARENLRAVGLVHEGDLFAALPGELRGRVDVMLANVPYVPTDELPLLPAEARLHEPPTALDGGRDGLYLLRRVAADAGRWLAPGGRVFLETTAEQAEAACAALAAGGLRPRTYRDANLDATVVSGQRR